MICPNCGESLVNVDRDPSVNEKIRDEYCEAMDKFEENDYKVVITRSLS
jgi:transcription initiation factor IIE alpha subunit